MIHGSVFLFFYPKKKHKKEKPNEFKNNETNTRFVQNKTLFGMRLFEYTKQNLW